MVVAQLAAERFIQPILLGVRRGWRPVCWVFCFLQVIPTPCQFSFYIIKIRIMLSFRCLLCMYKAVDFLISDIHKVLDLHPCSPCRCRRASPWRSPSSASPPPAPSSSRQAPWSTPPASDLGGAGASAADLAPEPTYSGSPKPR